MAGLCWMAVMLVFFLSAVNGLPDEDQNTLATIVNGILGVYNLGGGMFSLAVRIPYDQNQNIDNALQQVFTSDPAEDVLKKINDNEVYTGRRVVAAKVLKHLNGGDDHAESRVVVHVKDLLNNSNDNAHDLLLFYVYASPCIEKCLNVIHKERIIGRIEIIKEWTKYALVFSKIFKPSNGHTYTVEQLSDGLKGIGNEIGLNNIFRCDGPRGQKQCTSCADGEEVAGYCVSDPQPAATSG